MRVVFGTLGPSIGIGFRTEVVIVIAVVIAAESFKKIK